MNTERKVTMSVDGGEEIDVTKAMDSFQQETSITNAIKNLAGDLIENHWDEIKETWAQDEKAEMGISLSVSLKGQLAAPLVKVKMSFARKFSDEAAMQLEDPRQGSLL